eukprot:GEMP01002160.1.p1 GENE.GEMP01002160.1~~GEMP01002160.1.p1  ORF type:complete len:733 (+),score=158.27 GEMP01002160.1:302-2500(+)
MQRWEDKQRLRAHTKIVTGAKNHLPMTQALKPKSGSESHVNHANDPAALRVSPHSCSRGSLGALPNGSGHGSGHSTATGSHQRPPIRPRTPNGTTMNRGTKPKSTAPMSPALAPIFSYLKLFGLPMYARRLYDSNLGDLDQLARLSDTEALEVCELVKVFPGHKLKLLRAVDLLRRAAETHHNVDDIDVFDRLWNEKEKGEQQNQVLADENVALFAQLRSQDAYIMELRRNQRDLEELIQDRTAQCEFLTRQLECFLIMQQCSQGSDGAAHNLSESYDDWTRSATKLLLPEDFLQSRPTRLGAHIEELSSDEENSVGSDGIRHPTTTRPTLKLHPGMQALLDGTMSSFRHSAPPINPAEAAGGAGTTPINPAGVKGVDTPIKPTGGDDMHMKAETSDDSPSRDAVTSAARSHAAGTPLDACRRNRRNGAYVGVAEVASPTRAKLRRTSMSESGMLPDTMDDTPETGSPTCRMRIQRMGMSLDSAKVTECLSGFDVDHLLRCLAKALQNYIILSMASPRPHTAADKVMDDCSTFLERQCLQKLRARSEREPKQGAPHWLNDIALRRTPNLWTVYSYLNDIMVNFKLEQECAVITLIYLKRFIEKSKVSMTPDSWQRLTITSMMLASKVWDDESYENNEFAQLCPLYSLEEINSFQKHFLQCVKYDMSVKGSEYASTYFLLRTIGAKDLPGDFKIPAQLEPERCSRLMDQALAKQLEFKTRYVCSEVDPKNWTL